MTQQHTSTSNDQSDRGGLGAVGSPGAHTSVIRSVTVRVAGPVVTECFAHHYGTESQQVGVRAGDTLTYVEHPDAAVAVARVFSDAAAVAEREGLRCSVSPTWLGVEPGTWPPTLMQRHTTVPATAVGAQPRRVISGQVVPAHLWVRVGPVLWQVCDRIALDRLALVWSSCARLLTRPTTTLVDPGVAATRDENDEDNGPSDGEAPVPSQPVRATTSVRPSLRTAAVEDERTDLELLSAHVHGDTDALGVLAVRHGEAMAMVARRVLQGRGDPDDIVQTTWARVAVSAARFEGRSTVRTWLRRIAHNAALDHLRGNRPLVLDADAGVRTPSRGDAYRDADASMLVRQLLEVLPAAQRAAVELVDLQGRDTATAARLLAVAEPTVRSRLHRARERMAVEAARLDLHNVT